MSRLFKSLGIFYGLETSNSHILTGCMSAFGQSPLRTAPTVLGGFFSSKERAQAASYSVFWLRQANMLCLLCFKHL